MAFTTLSFSSTFYILYFPISTFFLIQSIILFYFRQLILFIFLFILSLLFHPLLLLLYKKKSFLFVVSFTLSVCLYIFPLSFQCVFALPSNTLYNHSLSLIFSLSRTFSLFLLASSSLSFSFHCCIYTFSSFTLSYLSLYSFFTILFLFRFPHSLVLLTSLFP